MDIASENPTQACAHLDQALDQLEQTWHSTAMARIRDVRRQLLPWQHEAQVHELDDRLYGWWIRNPRRDSPLVLAGPGCPAVTLVSRAM